MKTNKILMSAFALTVAFASLTSCSKDNAAAPLPQIGGYDNAGQVGKTDLVAYWPLNGDGIESISGIAPTTSNGATYETSTKGKSLNLVNGFLAYPELPMLASTAQSLTLSMWAKVTNNGGEGMDGAPTMLFSMSRPSEWAGNVNMLVETGQRAAVNDTLLLKGLVVIKKDDGSANFQDVVNSPNPSVGDIALGHVGNANKNGGKWTHYVMTWDAPTGTFKLYANGAKISNPAYEVRGGGSALPLSFFTPTKPIIGTFGTVVAGNPDSWQRPSTTSIDEIRVWKKTLSSADINALYELEKAGR